jgi:hypothetical protein
LLGKLFIDIKQFYRISIQAVGQEDYFKGRQTCGTQNAMPGSAGTKGS